MRRFIYFTILCIILPQFSWADNITQVISKKKLYLKKLNDKATNEEDFDELIALKQAAEVLALAKDTRYSKQQRSELLLIYSGIIGLYAKQEKSAEKGRLAYEATKDAVKIYPCNQTAAIAYASSLVGIDDSMWSFFAKKALGISGSKFYQEVNSALKFLARQESTKEVESLKKKLQSID